MLDENNELAEAFSRKIAERQAKLDKYSHAEPTSEKRKQNEQNILHRIKRFFSLK